MSTFFCVHLSLVIFISIASCCAPIKIALNDEDLDISYTKFLNFSMEEKSDENIDIKRQLKLRLAASNFYTEIIYLMRLLPLTNAKIHTNFEQLTDFVRKSAGFSHYNNCQIWKFRWEVINILVENNLMEMPMGKTEHMHKKGILAGTNCAEIGHFLTLNEQNQRSEMPLEVLDYLGEVKALHYKVFLFNLFPDFICDFSQFFGVKQIKNESNFAYRMRMMRLENAGANEKMAKIKRIIEDEFIGADLMHQLELKHPIYMAPDIIDDINLSVSYALLLSRDKEKQIIAENLLSIRIYYVRIWHCFHTIHLLLAMRPHNAKMDKKMEKFLVKIQKHWLSEWKEVHTLNNIMENNLYAYMVLLETNWPQLDDLVNQIRQQLASLDVSLLQHFQDVHQQQMVPPTRQNNTRHRLSEDHAKNMLRLAGTENAFSECLKNSLVEGNGSKIRLQRFFSSSPGSLELYKQLVYKYPQLKNLSRTELAENEITQLLIQNYIKLFDKSNDENVWRRAQLLVNILVFYQWLKNKTELVADDQELKFVCYQYLEVLELWMDSVSEFPLDEIKNECETRLTKFVHKLNLELFELLQMPNISDNSNSDRHSAAKNAKLAQQIRHNKTLKNLLSNSEFLMKLKAICIDFDRLNEFLCNGTIVEQIVSKNSNNKQPQMQINNHTKNLLSNQNDSVDDHRIDNEKRADQTDNNDKELIKLMLMYENVMFDNESSSAVTEKVTTKELLNFEATFFIHKTILKKLINLLMIIQSSLRMRNFGEKVKRLIIQLNVDIARSQLFVGENDQSQKSASTLCFMDSLLSHLLTNGTLFVEIVEWRRAIILHQYIDKQNGIPRPSDADLRWTKPECHKVEVAASVEAKLMRPMHLMANAHPFVLGQISQEFEHFVHFVNGNDKKILKSLKFEEPLSYSQCLSYYEIILGSADQENVKQAEALLVINLILIQIFSKEAAFLNTIEMNQIFIAHCELFATIRMLQIVLGETNALFWMFCPLLNYLNFLVMKKENPKIIWDTNIQQSCFKVTIAHHFQRQRNAMGPIHMEFFKKHLIEFNDDDDDDDDDEQNKLVKILREKSGAILRLRNLLGSEIDNFWHNEGIVRQRLINWQYILFFHNDARLLNHYHSNILSSADGPLGEQFRFKHRMAADIMVWMCRFEHHLNQQLQQVRHRMEILWLFFRSSYDIINDYQTLQSTFKVVPYIFDHIFIKMCKTKLGTNTIKKYVIKNVAATYALLTHPVFSAVETERHLSSAINELILDIEQFMDAHKATNAKKVLTEWDKLIALNFGKADSKKMEQETDEQNKNKNGENAIELVQKLHFNEFLKLAKSRRNSEKWDQIETALSSNNEQRKNIIQFLQLDDVKILFEMLGIAFDVKDFWGDQDVKLNNDAKIVMKENEKTLKKQNFMENQKNLDKNEEEKLQEKCKNNLLKEWHRIEQLNLKEFFGDQFLYEKYADFLLDPSDGKIVLLDIGAYVNEIRQRIEMWHELQQIGSTVGIFDKANELKLITNQWEMLLKINCDTVEKACTLTWNCHQILWELLNLNKNNLTEENVAEKQQIKKKGLENEVKNVKTQLHLRKLALALVNGGINEGEKWAQIGHKKRHKLLAKLTGMRCGHVQFDKLKMYLQKMDQQIQLDKLLLSNNSSKVEPNLKNHLSANFPKISQQINFVESLENEMVQKLEIQLKEIAYPNFAEFEDKMKHSLNIIRSIFNAWSNGHAKLLVSGSVLLGTHTIHSDIDLLCIVPGKMIKKDQIFGEDRTECQQQQKNNNAAPADGTKLPLYCQLYLNELVTDNVKFPYGPVLLIKFVVDHVPYDVTFVIIPDRKALPTTINDKALDDLMAKFQKQSEMSKQMLRVLSSYRSTLNIVNMLFDGQNNEKIMQINDDNDLKMSQQKTQQNFNKNEKNFRLLVIAMKLWAKNHYVYSNKYGYLNGAMLTIMVTKIVLLYPNASLPFLIEKFFLIYSMRPIFLPVQLNELEAKKENPFFIRNPEEQEMPVYTPTFPEQNVASLVTHCAAKLIQKEMIKALKVIKSIETTSNFEWKSLFQNDATTNGFIDKYQHFVLINCAAEQHTTISDKFCLFVDGRIRRQIVYDLDPKSGPTIGTHLYPDVYRHNCEMSNKFLTLAFRLSFCKIWLLGIASRVNSAEIHLKLAQFDATIRRDFVKYNNSFGEDDQQNVTEKKSQRKFKMPQIEDVNEKFDQFKLALKSILVKKWEMIDALESEAKENDDDDNLSRNRDDE